MRPEELIHTLIDEAFNKGDLSVLEEIIHPEYLYSSTDSQLTGIDQLSQFIQTFRSSFPDLNLQIDDLVATDNRSCTAFTLRGTHKEDFMGISATNKTVEIRGIVMSRIENDKIVEEWEILDNLSFFQQLGVVPKTL